MSWILNEKVWFLIQNHPHFPIHFLHASTNKHFRGKRKGRKWEIAIVPPGNYLKVLWPLHKAYSKSESNRQYREKEMTSVHRLLKCFSLGMWFLRFCFIATGLAEFIFCHLPILWMMDHQVCLSDNGWICSPFTSVVYFPLVTELSDDSPHSKITPRGIGILHFLLWERLFQF